MEKSAIPSKGDRGRSESDIERDLTPDTRGRHDERYVCDRMRARSCSGRPAAEPYHRPAPLSQDGFVPRDARTRRLAPDRIAACQAGELAAVHVMRGKQKGLRIKVIGRQPGLFDPI